ncbi:hypothetical protein DRQ00_07525 [candidate division KSB1 bacterium]|nr:MAG: hypothetical protein DRQ00_07525 [candidate division KSB1 bacterium]
MIKDFYGDGGPMSLKFRILLVEDNVDHAELTELALKQNIKGIEIDKTFTADETIAKISNSSDNNYDLMILDYSLPGKDGLAVLDSIYQKKLSLPVIIVTGQGNERVAVQAMKKGAFDYIVKSPGYLMTLPVTVKKALAEKHLENKQERTEQYYQNLVECANDGIYSLDVQGRITFVNRKVEQLTGFTRRELIGRYFKDLLVEKERVKIKRWIKQVRRKHLLENLETRVLTKDGRQIPVEINLAARNNGDVISGYYGVARDISMRLQWEAERRQRNEEIRRMNEELVSKNRELERLNQIKSQFVSNVSHELRTPLNGILGYAELLRDGLYGQVNEEQVKALQNVIACGHHLLDLINEILDFSKIQDGRMRLEREVCSVYDILEAVIATVKPTIREKNLNLILSVENKLPVINVDPRKIYQVFLNIIGNSIKFTEKGEIEIGAQKHDNEILFFVRDTGIGMKEEDVNKIFGEFLQLDGSISRKYGGTGLGLSLAKHFVEMHNGKIWVKSKWREGSTFYVSLPYEKDANIESSNITNKRKGKTVTAPGFFGI